MSSSSSYNSLPYSESIVNLCIETHAEHTIVVDEIHDKLKSATIDDLTSHDYDSWIFYCQYEKDQGRWSGNLVLGRETWDVSRLKRWERWTNDLAALSESDFARQ